MSRPPPGTQVGEDTPGSLGEPCTGLLSSPILADGLERTGATPPTLVLWQVHTDRDLGPWGCVAAGKGSLAAQKPGEGRAAPSSHAPPSLLEAHVKLGENTELGSTVLGESHSQSSWRTEAERGRLEKVLAGASLL